MRCLTPVHLHEPPVLSLFFFFNDTATTEIYTLSLHDALPIWDRATTATIGGTIETSVVTTRSLAVAASDRDRKSTRLNSSHVRISYAVFCLKKKKSVIAVFDQARIDYDVVCAISTRCQYNYLD